MTVTHGFIKIALGLFLFYLIDTYIQIYAYKKIIFRRKNLIVATVANIVQLAKICFILDKLLTQITWAFMAKPL